MRIDHPQLDPSSLAPGFVIAMPQLDDPNFRRAVVLMLKSEDVGSFGLVINHPSAITVNELCKDQGIDYSGPNEALLMIGGPVETDTHLLVLHGDRPVFDDASGDEMELCPGLRIVTAAEGLTRLAERGSERLRCFAGYAGWGPGQLEEELEAGAWLALPADPQLLFEADFEGVWNKAIRQAGIDPAFLVPGQDLN